MAEFILRWPRQTLSQALHFSGKVYAFLVSPRQKPSSRRLKALGQTQHLVGEVGENCLI